MIVDKLFSKNVLTTHISYLIMFSLSITFRPSFYIRGDNKWITGSFFYDNIIIFYLSLGISMEKNVITHKKTHDPRGFSYLANIWCYMQKKNVMHTYRPLDPIRQRLSCFS